MPQVVELAGRLVGAEQPVFIVAEIGINHNGDLEIAKQLIDIAKAAGCDAVKFQKRVPELSVPAEQRNLLRETPWGLITYMDYRCRVEFGQVEYEELDRYCRDRKIIWFASAWDAPSIQFLEQFDPPCIKIPSARLTDEGLLHHIRDTGRAKLLSTGMSSMAEIRQAVTQLGTEDLVLMHCTSSYPCKPDELNLRTIQTLHKEFDCPVGYSGHEVGLQTTYAAVVLGACAIERHITLDRAMWGSDQAASVEPGGLMRLTRDIRIIERAMGDGVKQVYKSEEPSMRRLRGIDSVSN